MKTVQNKKLIFTKSFTFYIRRESLIMSKNSKKLLSFLLIACMLSSNMAVPASYAQTVNDGTANQNLETSQDSSAKSDDKVEAQGKEQDSSPAQKVEDGSTQGAKADENQNGTVEKKDEKDAQGNQEQQTNPSVENQQNEQGNTGLNPSIPMVTVPDQQNPQAMISNVLSQDAGTIINQLGEQQLAPGMVSDYLKITGVVIGRVGDDAASKEALQIQLKNDSEDSFYTIQQKIVSVSIDDLNVPLRDEQYGWAAFIMVGDNNNDTARYECYYDGVTGKKTIDDFKKRTKHKVVMNFSDGSTIKYEDEGYVRPEGREENNGNKPKPPVTGNAAEYEIKEAYLQAKPKYGDAEIRVTFKKGDMKKLQSLIKEVKVGKTTYNSSYFAVNSSNELYIIGVKDLVAKEKENTPVTVEIIFKDGSVLSNATNSNQNDPNQPVTVNAYLITKDTSKTSYIDKMLIRKVNIVPTDRTIGNGMFKAYQVKLKFEDLVIGNKTYKVKNVRYDAMNSFRDAEKLGDQTFGFDIPSIALKPETSTEDLDLGLIVELDKEVPGYDNPTKTLILKLDWNGDFKQPEEEKPTQLAEGYSITGTEFADNDKKFIINLNKEMPENVLKRIQEVTVNGKAYDSEDYPFKTVANTIYFEEPDGGTFVSTIKAKGINTLDIVFKDQSKISYKKETKPQPSEKIASNYSITGTKLTTDTFTIELNKEMTDEHLKKLKTVTINAQEFHTHTFTFKKKEKTIYIEEDEDEYAQIIPKLKKEGVQTLQLVFEDGSRVYYPNNLNPIEKIADSYVIKNHEIKDSNKFLLTFEKKLTAKELELIKSVKINNLEFEREKHGFTVDAESGKLQSENKEVLAQAEKNKNDIVIEVIFKDDSKATYKKAGVPDGGYAKKFELTGAEFGTNWEKKVDKVVFKFTNKMTYKDAQEVKSIKINDKVFEKSQYSFSLTFDRDLKAEHEDIIKQFTDNQYDLNIEIAFSDGTVTKKEFKKQKPVEKFAEKFKLTKAQFENINATKKFILTFANNMATEDLAKIEKVKINGKEFTKEALNLTAVAGKVETLNAELIAEVEKNKDNLKLEVVFTDKSVTNLDTKIDISEKLTIESNLPDGDYTLSYKAYVEGKNQTEVSTLAGYFDKRVKLKVSGNKKTVSFLNHLYADLIIDFALKNGQTYVPFTKNVVESETNGSPKKVEYTVELNDLTGTKLAAVLGSGPMGGNIGDKGQYDGAKYRRVEIVFDKELTKGWTDYKVIEDAKNQKLKNDMILNEALIANGLDTNKDGTVSEEELRNATGIQKPKSIDIPGFPMTNVIDLEAKGITDISILKNLGPKIKGINLNGNKIEELPKGLFDNATGVTHLILGANKIKSIDKDVFKPLKDLEYIDFDGNPLVRVPEGLFDANTKLRMLSLMNTALESVPANLIKNNTSLREVYMQENKLKSLPDDFFANNRRLSRVVLFSNQLENIPSSLGEDKPHLRIIQANNNKITSIPDSFATLLNLTDIELSNNRISYVPDEFFVNMVKYSKIRDIRLKLGSNNIKSLPVDKMISALGEGKEIKYFQVGMNNLPMDLSEDEKAKFKKVGVSFDDESYGYYPQRTAIKAKATVEQGKVKLNQNIDILELYYWGLSDIVNREKKMFTSEMDFVNYLTIEGRDNNNVSRSLPRDEAIAKILSNKTMQWKVETVITKGSEVVYSSTKTNENEGQVQEFNIANFEKDEQYTITKTMYVFVPSWGLWQREVEYSVSFTGQGTDDKFEQVNVKMNMENSDKPSMANPTLKPVANLEKVGNKFKYTLFFKPMEVMGTKGEVEKFFIKKGGKLEEVPVKLESGEYNKSFTFELDEKVQKLPVAFEVKGMQAKMSADIIFEYSNAPKPKPPVNKDEKTVKGYILNADGKSVSMADQSLERDIRYKKIDK